ncbi:MAG: cohesin domain-containing protein [candidate division Zixibacteria bacterium]|nr:cohesin domain-containing protein [candidate division Zixibacteria bacterium]
MEKRKILKVICWNFLSLLLFSGLAFAGNESVIIPDTSGSPGEYVKIPVKVNFILAESLVTAAQLSLSFNPNLLELDSVSFDGTLIPQDWQKAIFPPDDSTLNVALAGAYPINGSGTLIYVRFKVLSSASVGDSSVIHFKEVKLNEWVPPVIKDGVLRITPTSVFENENLNLPQNFSLGQNFPNPFNPTTTIPLRVKSLEWGVGRPVHTTLVIYNVLGQRIRSLVDENLNSGTYQVIWDAKNDRGEKVPSGVYFYRLTSGDVSEARKMVLLR